MRAIKLPNPADTKCAIVLIDRPAPAMVASPPDNKAEPLIHTVLGDAHRKLVLARGNVPRKDRARLDLLDRPEHGLRVRAFQQCLAVQRLERHTCVHRAECDVARSKRPARMAWR